MYLIFVKKQPKFKYDIEIQIGNILKSNPHPNIVLIYDVSNSEIKMELLETNIINMVNENMTKFINSMIKAKEHLNKLGISYIDWKIDNVGYSAETNEFKLFDFDCSGMFDIETKQ
jgi:serine/threonine protein kinase